MTVTFDGKVTTVASVKQKLWLVTQSSVFKKCSKLSTKSPNQLTINAPIIETSKKQASWLVSISGVNYLTGVHPSQYLLVESQQQNFRKRSERCWKLTIKTPEWHHGRRYGVFIVNFEHISHLFLVFLFLPLSK